MKSTHPRMIRESKTITAMMHIYCRELHGTSAVLCPDCQALESYAQERLDRCPFQETKSTCAKCAIHCYRPDMRERVRQMMRYAGPRMIRKHPLLAIHHILDGLRRAPAARRKEPSMEK